MEDFLLNALATTPSMMVVVMFLHFRIKRLEVYIDKNEDVPERVAVLEALRENTSQE